MQEFNKYKFLFGAGGTGGHLFPALAVAEKIKELKPQAEILFLGNKNKIEGKTIPKYGFQFKHINVEGFHRGEITRNLLFPFKLLGSVVKSVLISMKFKPRVAVGSGAYVSGPVLWAADFMGAKLILMEQNSYPGITNRLLDRKATVIFTAFEESKKYFRIEEKVEVVGNPVRPSFKAIEKEEAKAKLGIPREKKTLLVLGGSLGAKSINEAIKNNIQKFVENEIYLLWQTGKRYYDEYENYNSENVKVFDFIDDMGLLYSAADLVIARAGATTIAEVAFLGKATIFVPSPNVAENHQYKNAEELVKNNAVELIKDDRINEEIFDKVISLLENRERIEILENNIKQFSNPDATEIIAKRAIKLAES